MVKLVIFSILHFFLYKQPLMLIILIMLLMPFLISSLPAGLGFVVKFYIHVLILYRLLIGGKG